VSVISLCILCSSPVRVLVCAQTDAAAAASVGQLTVGGVVVSVVNDDGACLRRHGRVMCLRIVCVESRYGRWCMPVVNDDIYGSG
jgi:hypothetical protein